MRFLHRGAGLPDGFVEVKNVIPCVDVKEKELGPLLTVQMVGSDRVFLLDTGNLRSTFCVKEGLKRKGKDCKECKCSAPIALKDGSQIEIEGDVLGWEPQSLVNIPCGPNGEMKPSGNLGLDVWIGIFESTIFDFGMKGSKDHKIFCKPSGIRGRSRVKD